MVAFSFNAGQHSPQYSGGGGLPAGPNGEDVIYDVMIVDSMPVDTKDQFGNTTGGYLELVLASIAGPTQGTRQSDRLNLMHKKPQVAEIANKQLSAYCHVLGKFQFNDTAELHNIPFKVKIGLQRAPNPNNYTEVKGVYDANGNEPGKAGSGAPAGGQQQGGQPDIPPAGGVQAQGGGWGGGNGGGGQQQGGAPIDNNVPMNQGQGGGQPNGQGGGWGGPNQGGQPNQQQGQQQGGWGGQGGGQPNQGQQQQQGGGQGGWGQQNGGQQQGGGGGQPGWGQGQGGGQPGWGGQQ